MSVILSRAHQTSKTLLITAFITGLYTYGLKTAVLKSLDGPPIMPMSANKAKPQPAIGRLWLADYDRSA
jgi:hypothetical protein